MSRLPPWLLMIVIGLIVGTFPVWALTAHLMINLIEPYLLALWPLILLVFAVRWYLKRRGSSQT